MQIGSFSSTTSPINAQQKPPAKKILTNEASSSSSPSSVQGTYDFSSMTDQQMRQSKNALVSSGKLSIQQGLTLDMMIGVPVGSSVPQNGGADGNQTVNWYSKIQEATSSAKGNGNSENEVAVLKNMQDVFQSLQGSIASMNRTV